ncbi:MAG: MFS transporter, partial [Actinomycetota bacterium]|nr:MFS transporter [Actinomycetota bacterium]
MTHARLITAASFVGSLGWGLILPFQYAYVVNAREWGSTIGVLTGTVFCVGAVVAAPLAGRLADRYPAGRVAVGCQLLAAAASVGLGLADSAAGFLVAIALFGAAVTASAPASQVLVLECVHPAQRRAVFAYQFTALALGMAGGAFVGGHLIDLSDPDGMGAAFSGSAAGFVAAAALLHGASRLSASHRAVLSATDDLAVRPGGLAAYRHLAQSRPVRLLAIVSMALAAGFYAQFET